MADLRELLILVLALAILFSLLRAVYVIHRRRKGQIRLSIDKNLTRSVKAGKPGLQLNPSPFCMLDEVDAPLDDTNIIRFTALLRELSEHVQFILVTHNKISMETANQLLGITMQEAGISRVVSVDIDEAAEMATA